MAGVLAVGGARSQTAAEAAAGPPYVVAVLVSSRPDLCYDNGYVAAITRLVRLEEARINRQGGIAGRPVRVEIFDDAREPNRAIGNVEQALAMPDLLAIVGLTNSNLAKAVFDKLGTEIRKSGVPFLTDTSVSSLIEGQPSVFTTRASQEEERVPIITQFVSHVGFARPAFVGLGGSVFSAALGDGLKQAFAERGMAGDHRLALSKDKLDAAAVKAAVADLKTKEADFVVLSVGTQRTADVIAELIDARHTPALLMTGRIADLPKDIVDRYPNAIYQLAWDGLPELYSERLRRRVAGADRESWVFEGRRNDAAPGWASGTCKARPADQAVDPLDAANLRAIGFGGQFADMVSLAATSAAATVRRAGLAERRAAVVKALTTTYATGRGAFKGTFQNWSFKPSSRTAARTPFILILPQGLGRVQLAPIQFQRLRNDTLKRIETVYLDIDLIRAHRIDDNQKTFAAEFYLAMRSQGGAAIEQVDFTNAFLDPSSNGRQLTIEMLHDGKRSDAFPEATKVYRVTGRFVFNPDLASYPFDRQRFTIDIQPKRGDVQFIVQPPPQELRDTSVATDGWDPKAQYVGYDEDFVPVLDAYSLSPSVVPFYKASFVWEMQRQTTDYYLRVIVPLGFILIVAYLSIFIPLSNFEAIVTIQVTALLSAVALYLSLPKLDADTATVSDKLFVFNYMMVSLMIVISILMVNRHVAQRAWVRAILQTIHIAGIPGMVIGMAWWVWKLSNTGA
ncbi:MAG: ABC transporter substrate-binding protein [Hyphomicrobiaceae bacterium]